MSTDEPPSHEPLYPEGPHGTGEAIIQQTRRRCDDDLLAAAAGGEPGAWLELVNRVHPTIWAATGTAGLPADIATTVCDLVWRRLAQLLPNQPTELRPWIYDIVAIEASRWHRGQEDTVVSIVEFTRSLAH